MNRCRNGMFYFFFNDTATTEIYTLSLHDALPIWAVVLLVVILAVLNNIPYTLLGLPLIEIIIENSVSAQPNLATLVRHCSQLDYYYPWLGLLNIKISCVMIPFILTNISNMWQTQKFLRGYEGHWNDSGWWIWLRQ